MGPQGLKLLLAPPAWRLLASSLRLVGEAPPAPGPARIFACLHRDILPAIIHVRPARPTLLVSASADGDILTRTLGHRDYRYVRGATGENGARALVALRRELAQGRSIGLAVDGPQGPFGVINEGVVQLSRLAGAPIVGLRAEPGRHTVLGTWDRTVVPHPFSRVRIVGLGPFTLPPAADAAALLAARRQLAAFFGVEGDSHEGP